MCFQWDYLPFNKQSCLNDCIIKVLIPMTQSNKGQIHLRCLGILNNIYIFFFKGAGSSSTKVAQTGSCRATLCNLSGLCCNRTVANSHGTVTSDFVFCVRDVGKVVVYWDTLQKKKKKSLPWMLNCKTKVTVCDHLNQLIVGLICFSILLAGT